MARKEEILDALIEIFRAQGIGSDFTMSQLAKEVNIGKSTIYEYFKTKDSLIIKGTADPTLLYYGKDSNSVVKFLKKVKSQVYLMNDKIDEAEQLLSKINESLS